MQFTKLKITGFKSFVEPIEFPIEAGMTGIVGPNGCGKSNVVEALRWGMGENSAKRLRGSEMDDVIFAGSAGRPARNLAEVTLHLDNKQKTALAEFNAEDEIEVTRRIERGMGSDYRINSRPVRQKDVQLLFADQATGAHSTSIVSQGKVSALISAKPEERRQVLEEAAGVSGLHARRHEAELKLRAAETNLARVGDQLQLMDQQLRGLKTQVRQTSRYRNLGDLIRKAEAGILYLKIRAAEAALHAAEAAFAQSEAQVRELTSGVAVASAAAAESASTLAPLRQGEAAASAVVQRLHLERETLEREAKRISDAQEANARRIAEVKSDRAREEALGEEARGALAKLADDKTQTETSLKTMEGEEAGMEARVTAARASTATQEKIFQEKTREFAETSAQEQSLAREAEALHTRAKAIETRLKEIEAAADAAQAEARAVDPSLAKALVTQAEADLAQKQEAVKAAQEARSKAEEKLNEMRARRETAQSEKARLEAEVHMLRVFLHGTEGTPLADQLGVEKAYQAALAAALGEGLLASLDAAAKTFWQDLGGVGLLGAAGLPRGATPLLNHVNDVPAALKRALSHAGIVENFETGERLARELKPGQILVSPEGDSWRWDGYTQRHDAETPAAARLRQHARLVEAEAVLAEVSPRVATADENFNAADQEYQNAQTGSQQAEAAQQQGFTALFEARERHAEKARERAEVEARVASLGENLGAARAEENEILIAAQGVETKRKILAPLAQLQEGLDAAGKILAEQRGKLVETETAQAGYRGRLESARARLRHIAESAQSWTARAETGTRQLQELATRQTALEEEGRMLAQRPAEIETERQALLSRSTEAEANRRAAADALIGAEQKQAGLDKESQAASGALMEAKESRVRFEEQMFRAKSGFDELALRIREHWHCPPEELPGKAAFEPGKLEALEELEENLARYNRERENMGPVNLRAEIEADEIQAQMDRITSEKSDLEGAIAKLRQGISTLNREARERLATAFADVDKNFGSLFERLFGGGKAHLKLIESDDPLEAGLEIYASPPGKRMQILSLLSGGEQALTALSLLFAIFMVNPSPICVLDEVDAPLDEANVDRFCTMVREMTENGKTRFLIVTHHRLTMARMDRLFGVTMAEKGVSQLVSVDLKQALAMREQGSAAAEAEFETAAA